MRFSKQQFDSGEERHVAQVLDESLLRFERDMRPDDPQLAKDIADYRRAGDMDLFKRIIRLTDIGTYQRILLAMILQSGIDVTTDAGFGYILDHPLFSGNTKARHLILMAVALQQTGDQTS